MLTPAHQSALKALLGQSGEIIDSTSPNYGTESAVWSHGAHQNPKLVLRPSSVQALQNVIKYLGTSDLDFAIRGTGTGDASAADVVVNTGAFKSFEYNADRNEVLLGAGLNWGEAYRLLDKAAPGQTMVGARQPFVGVSGCILGGGLSWLSGRHGLPCDPHNFLDAQVALLDGRLIWASEDPELLWGLRGGGGNFGVVVTLKVRSFTAPEKVCAGIIAIPSSAIPSISPKYASWVASETDPDVLTMTCPTDPSHPFFPMPRSLGLMIFDAHGEAHARATFPWAFEAEGAMVMCQDCRYIDALLMNGCVWVERRNHHLVRRGLMRGVAPDFLERSMEMYEQILQGDSELVDGSYILLEQLGRNTFTNGQDNRAWPHDTYRQVLQFGVGYKSTANSLPEPTLKTLDKGIKELAPDIGPADFLPSFCRPGYTDVAAVYGKNYQRLRQLKTKYDPKGRFNHAILYIPPLSSA